MSIQPKLCKQAFINKETPTGYTAPHKRNVSEAATFDTAFPELAKPVTELKQHSVWSNASDKLKGQVPATEVQPQTDTQPPTYAELLTGIKVVDVSNDPYYAWEPLEKKAPSELWKYIYQRRALDKLKPKFMFTEDLIEAEELAAATKTESEEYSETDDNESLVEDDSEQM